MQKVNSPDDFPESPRVTLERIYEIVKLRKAPLLLWMVLCLGAAGLFGQFSKRTFTATTTILLDPKRPSASGAQDAQYFAGLDVSRADSELQVMRSERLLSKVFDSMDLAANPEFSAPANENVTIVERVRRYLAGPADHSKVKSTNEHQEAFERFSQQFSTRRVGQSYVVELSYTSIDPTLSRKIANAATSAYLLQSIVAKVDAARNGGEFLQGRLNALAAQAQAASEAVVKGSLPSSPTPDADARVIGAALQPLSPSAPRKFLILAFGGVIGLIGGVLWIALLQLTDSKVRYSKYLRRVLGVNFVSTFLDSRKPGSVQQIIAWALNGDNFHLNERLLRSLTAIRVSAELSKSLSFSNRNAIIGFLSLEANIDVSCLVLGVARILSDEIRKVSIIDVRQPGTQPKSPESPNNPLSIICFSEMMTIGVDELRRNSREKAAAGPLEVGKLNFSAYPSYLASPILHASLLKLASDRIVIVNLPCAHQAPEVKVALQNFDILIIGCRGGKSNFVDLVSLANDAKSAGIDAIGVVIC